MVMNASLVLWLSELEAFPTPPDLQSYTFSPEEPSSCIKLVDTFLERQEEASPRVWLLRHQAQKSTAAA